MPDQAGPPDFQHQAHRLAFHGPGYQSWVGSLHAHFQVWFLHGRWRNGVDQDGRSGETIVRQVSERFVGLVHPIARCVNFHRDSSGSSEELGAILSSVRSDAAE